MEHLIVYSMKSGKTIKIQYIKSYNVETSIDVPADAFEIIIGNQGYEISDLISAGDKIYFYIENDLALQGYIDDIDIEYTIDSNDIRITGRDEVAVLLDNSAYPKTYNNIGLGDYLGKVLPKYNIGHYSDSNSKIKKITISPGDNEYDIIQNLCNSKYLIPIYNIVNGRLECVKPISTTNYSYHFSNTSPGSTRMTDVQVSISNDIVDEVTVYGGDFSKSKQIKGYYSQSKLKTKKRLILNDSEIEKVSDADKRAKKEFYDKNKSALSVTFTTPTHKPIYINKCAYIYIKKMEFSAHLLVDSVTYTKSIDAGTLTNVVLKLMPGISVSFKNNDIPTLPEL